MTNASDPWVPVAPQGRARLRRLNTALAISLAQQAKWEEAAEANERIMQAFPDDAEALNRLGKAYLDPAASKTHLVPTSGRWRWTP